jgi:hypothetical protein
MSGGQGGRCRFENALSLLMNFDRPATCRYHMPYVVAYVVPDVVSDVGRGRSRRNFRGAVLSGWTLSKFRWRMREALVFRMQPERGNLSESSMGDHRCADASSLRSLAPPPLGLLA